MSEENSCWFKSCKGRVEISYYGKLLCDKHWDKLSSKSPDEVKDILEIKKEKNHESIQKVCTESSIDKSLEKNG